MSEAQSGFFKDDLLLWLIIIILFIPYFSGRRFYGFEANN